MDLLWATLLETLNLQNQKYNLESTYTLLHLDKATKTKKWTSNHFWIF